MVNERNTKFRVESRTTFLKTVNPSFPTLEGKIGLACTDSADQLLKKIREKRLNKTYRSSFSISADNINRHIERVEHETVEFTITVLNTFLCFFFLKKSTKYQYAETHTEQNLRDFFNHITIRNGKDSDLKKFNKFLNDLELVKEDLTPLFNDFSFEINSEWEFSMIKNITTGIDSDYKEFPSIKGTTLINNSFFQRIKKMNFTITDFFTSNMDVNCQWYGIVNSFDVPRQELQDLIKISKTTFKTPRVLKISAIIYGDSGVGKSTLLRRLSFELKNETFKTLWLNKNELSIFLKEGLNVIETDFENNYLIIIEAIDVDLETMSVLLKRIENFTNVRVIISTNKIEGTPYYKYLINREHKYFINNDKNSEILSQILIKHPQWENIRNEIIEKENSNNMALYLSLYIIARLNNENKTTKIDLSDASTVFEKIIADDFRELYKAFPGLAKILFYLSSTYIEHKLIPLYDHFLLMGDVLNQNTEISEIFHDLNNGESHIHKILRSYIHTYKSPIDDRLYLFFNHDYLVDSGISKMLYFIPELGVFDDIVKKKLLKDTFKNVENDIYFSFSLLEFMIKKNIHVFRDDEEIFSYINKILESKEGKYYYSYFFELKELSDYLVRKCLNKLLFSKIRFSRYNWADFFIENPKIVNMILNHWSIIQLPPTAIVVALRFSKSESDKKRAVAKLLQAPNLDKGVLASCNKVLKENEKKTPS